MRHGFLWVMGVWVLAPPTLPRTALPPPPPPPGFPGISEALNPPVLPISPLVVESPPLGSPLRYWVRAEFLSWWVKNAPMPVSPIAIDNAMNNPGTPVFNSDVDYRAMSGSRFSFGGWFDRFNNIGMEMSYFTLGQRTRNLFTSSDDNGGPTLAFPFFNQSPGANAEFLLPISTPGQFAGNTLISSSIALWGTEVNGAFCLLREPGLEFIVLAGFRYVDLLENLSINSATTSLAADNTTTLLSDNFNMRNQFYGGQLGGRLNWYGDRLGLDMTAKVALGSTHEVVDIQGYAGQFGPKASNATTPGGLYAAQQ